MNKNFVVKNRQKLCKQMVDNSILVFFAGKAKHRSADQGYEFTPNRNFWYLTSLDKEEYVLVITKFHGKVDEILFINEPNPDIEKWTGIRLRVEEVKEISGIQKIRFLSDFNNYFVKVLQDTYFENIYLDTIYQEEGFTSNGLEFAKYIQTHFPHLNVKSTNQIIYDLRTIKEDIEIEYIKKAIDITNIGIQNIMKNASPGILERQLEAYYDFSIKYHGANHRSFKTIMASGKNAVILHYEENKAIIEDNTLILFDLGSEYEYYCSDISRTIPANGKFTPRQIEVYESVLRVNEAMIKMVKPGLLWKDFLGIAKDMLADECIKLGLITDKKDVDKYYYHGVGHYLGLDVHDVGRRDNLERSFEKGMVITVEPGLYIAEEGIGIRIEDDVLVTETGHENLSKDIIKSVDDIENFMKK